MEISYLLFLQYVRTVLGGIFDSFFLQISEWAMVFHTMLLMSAIYWCVDKRTGQKMALNVSLACTLNQAIKNIFKIDRPWVISSEITPVEAAIADAGGYSFPSGHTSRAFANYGVLGAECFKKRKSSGLNFALSIFFWGYTALVMFSRNYLGVHTPKDVLGALILGIVVLVAVDKVLQFVDKRPEFDIVMWIAGCLICFVPMLKLGCQTNAGYGIGLLTGWIIERRFVKFEENGSYLEKVVRFIIGGAILVFLLKSLAPWLCLFMASKYAGFFANFVSSIYVMALYPFVFSRAFASAKGLGRLWKSALAVVLAATLVMGMSAALKHRHDTEATVEEVTSDEQVVEADLEAQTVDVQMSEEASDPGSVVIAHRGYCGEYPENTMASFNGALDIGADFVETDVQMTADGVLVLYHDDTLLRITGDEGAIADYTYEELLQKDF
ncbi:MAG: phosphatase PAP2 family protein, partial [Butyrivibrio sp.]|nr:phosphatase PAP2 family protein [Butyrivibrio sp.]